MRLAIFLVILVLLQIYAFQAVKSATRLKYVWYFYLAVSALILLNFFLRFLWADNSTVFQGARAYAFGFLLALLAGQLVLLILMFAEDIARVVIALFSKKDYTKGHFYMPSRRNFLAKLALGLAAIPFSSLLYGMYKGKYNFKVLEYDLEFEDLPEAFEGYKITQISDIHCGSFDNFEKIKYGVELIKAQKSDLVLFTGDLVNNKAEETEEWKALFGSIRAEDGVFSVLGNHDYGQYYHWQSKEEEQENLRQLKLAQKEMGWELLLNENRTITRGEDQIHLVGVENWGNGHFPKYGDENKAAADLTAKDFKILMSHDPSHFDEKIKHDPRNYQLTLSGHTHGMQFGIEIPGVVKWSPVEYRYKYWAGIYEEEGRYINVNRGFGYLAYPGRVGVWPEITVIRLKKKRSLS